LRLKGNLQGIAPAETDAVFQDRPALVLVTHGYYPEVFAALGGLPKQNNSFTRNVKLIAQGSPERTWLTEHILPVWPHRLESDDRTFWRNLYARLEGRRMTPKEEARRRNTETIRTASRCIADGSIVVMCPEGTRDKSALWQSGAGRIVKETKVLLREKEGYVIFCSVAGASFTTWVGDKLLGISPYRHITARYSEPIPLSALDKNGLLSNRELSRYIEAEYRKWLLEIKRPSPSGRR